MELDLYLIELNEEIEKAINNYENQLTKVVIGRANPNLVNKIKINYYDSMMNLDEIASISIASPLQLLVKPYDMAIIKVVEKAIMDYKLNVSISNEGHQLRLTYPQMTTDKRKEMVKQLNLITEQAKVGIRQARQDINKKVKADKELSEDLQKHYLDVIQKEIDKNIVKVDGMASEKEKDLMTI
ncbi:ribosome recycling factor [Metamycoplasma cloacale]|uniref:Ribosome recycling factor n=1 Tax=Metamycoplasma cloacale TaxID=92401 RepID=A0A2Z4LLK3_9BACT|nr:ribosome-recycling factor [Metamycoplasma cloacale]AWX42544.1 ribosome recycling factor [Metamycoplasma cloacale]VEU79782.1 ribosome recycling factor [Metamycoplasma cloacale]